MNSPVRKPSLLALTLLCALVTTSRAQVAFQNLNFEAAFPNILPTSPIGTYPVTTALPGWTVYYGVNQQSVQQSEMGYNLTTEGNTFVALLGGSAAGSSLFDAIEGNYSVILQGGESAPEAAISQTGLVPVLSESIQFKAVNGNGGPLLLSLGGQNIPYHALASGPNYTLYGGDISAFAGQTEQLEFLAPEEPEANNNWNIDSIVFSPNPVPEPQVWTLLLSGAVALALKRRQLKT